MPLHAKIDDGLALGVGNFIQTNRSPGVTLRSQSMTEISRKYQIYSDFYTCAAYEL
jgi:hypothetical protein